MIHSMTGYGQVTEVLDGVSYSAEIRTVNNRYFKINTRVPESVSFLEDTIERYLRKEFSRGMVNFNLRLKNLACADFRTSARPLAVAAQRRVNGVDPATASGVISIGPMWRP